MRKKLSFFVGGLLIFSLCLGIGIQQAVQASVPGVNTLLSMNNSGSSQGGNNLSPISGRNIAISADGKFVSFSSGATNLVGGDTNGFDDIFVRDLANNVTTRVNVSSSGVQANSYSNSVSGPDHAISSNGRYVAFISRATNLIDGQTTPWGQVYIRDTVANTTTLVTQNSSGTIGNSYARTVGGVSNDGKFVLWSSNLETNLLSSGSNTLSEYVYLADLRTRTFTNLTPMPTSGQYSSNGLKMSCDGSFITFNTKLQLDTTDTDASYDVYLVDIRNGMTTNGVTTSSNAAYTAGGDSISCNGDYIVFSTADSAFSSLATNMKNHHYLYNRLNETITLVDTSSAGVIGNNNTSSAGVDNNGNVAFTSSSSNLLTGLTIPYSQVYLKNKINGITELISRTSTSPTSYSNSSINGEVVISSDGKVVAYPVSSASTNLITSDTNGFGDVISSSTGL